MKIKCHLHSTEASVRNMELGLANAIRKSNPEYDELFNSQENCIHALDLAKKYLPQFNSASVFSSIIIIYRNRICEDC